jgi:hypothetical protein
MPPATSAPDGQESEGATTADSTSACRLVS